MIAVAAVVIPLSAWLSGRSGNEGNEGAKVGGDLHAVAAFDGRVFVSGHRGAGYLTASGSWQGIASLEDRDAMAWAQTSAGLLVAGHGGLYTSTNGGDSFGESAADLPMTDIHAIGAADDVVYLASPQGGLFASSDGGRSFSRLSDAGATFMGTISVDPENPDRAIAADMSAGAVLTTDGGVTWLPLGGVRGAMAVAVNPTNANEIVVIGISDSVRSADGGQSWAGFEVPERTATAAFDPTGRLLVAILDDDRAEVLRMRGDSWVAIA